jgi:hypothetical protein
MSKVLKSANAKVIGKGAENMTPKMFWDLWKGDTE